MHMHVMVIVRLGKNKARDKLRPLLLSPIVEHVTLIRHGRVPIESPKLTQIIHEVGLQDDGSPRSLLAALRNIIACFYNGYRSARTLNPQVIIAFNLFPYGVIAWSIARLTKKQVILSLIGSDFDRSLQLFGLRYLLKLVLKTSNGIVIFGVEARNKLERDGFDPKRLFVLPNTVDTDLFFPDPESVIEADLVYVGNLHDFKRVDVILHGLAKIHQTRPETTLWIIGDGAEKNTLINLAISLGIQHKVTFVGWTDRIAEFLRKTRILLLLSEHEGLPAVVIEALCTGLPVIATDVGAISSVLFDEKNGYLIPVPPPPDLVADRVLQLLLNADHYQSMSQQALATRATHGYPQASQVWNDVLRNSL